jgi:hypothetical protein
MGLEHPHLHHHPHHQLQGVGWVCRVDSNLSSSVPDAVLLYLRLHLHLLQFLVAGE